jgi:hypothetical protein
MEMSESNQNLPLSTLMKEAEKYLGLFVLQIADEDLDRLEKELGNQKAKQVLLTMMVAPKEDWERLGVPKFMMKYEVEEEED